MGRLLLLLAALTGTAGAQSPADIASLQSKLHFLGYAIDSINGIYGPQTRRAVEAFEFSIGMGDEGELNPAELALLDAQVAAEAFERFGYRLLGFWSARPCEEGATEGVWMEDLAWIANADQRFPLVETTLSEPLLVNWEDRQQVVNTPYFSAVNTGADIRFFPLADNMLVIAGEQVFSLTQCQWTLEALPADLSGSVLNYGPPELGDVN